LGVAFESDDEVAAKADGARAGLAQAMAIASAVREIRRVAVGIRVPRGHEAGSIALIILDLH
jgi:hypothetical protein